VTGSRGSGREEGGRKRRRGRFELLLELFNYCWRKVFSWVKEASRESGGKEQNGPERGTKGRKVGKDWIPFLLYALSRYLSFVSLLEVSTPK
jgi:hypothetical protein